MKIRFGQWGEYDFDKEDAKIVVPLILLLLGLTLTPLRKEWLIGAAAALLPPVLLSSADLSGDQETIRKAESLAAFQMPVLQRSRTHFARHARISWRRPVRPLFLQPMPGDFRVC
jgi:hypothetical protein